MPYPFEHLRRTLWPVRTGMAFLLYPFDGDGEQFCVEVARPAVVEAGLEPDDARSHSGSQPILEDILNGIASADVVIGVLVGRNQNVFWELGIAHTWKPPTQVLTVDTRTQQQKSRIPFNLQGFRHIVVCDENPPAARQQITERLQCLMQEHEWLREEAVCTARNALGPGELVFAWRWAQQQNFMLPAYRALPENSAYNQPDEASTEPFRNETLRVGPRLLATHMDSIAAGNLCRLGLLACNTSRREGERYFEASFWWTPLGNAVLEKIGVISGETAQQRWEAVRLIPEVRNSRGAYVFGPILQQ